MEELCVKFISPKGVSSKHIIYCKRHALRKNSTKTPNDRTLFSIGWPPYCSEDIIHELFSRTSEVETVFLRNSLGNVEETEEKKVTVSFRRRDFGYIVFKTKEGLDEVLKMCKSNMTLSCPIKHTGLSALYNDYKRQRPPIRILRARAEKQVEKYDTLKDEERKRKRLLSEPDEEGWITVTKKNAVDTDTSVAATSKRKRKKTNVHLKLYPFQMRETQRERLAELRKKFQEDKKRVAIMKAQRKFKPF